VEICIAEVGATPADDELYHVTFDGSVSDEPGYVAMGGQNDAITNVLKEGHRETLALPEALALAVKALGSVGGEAGAPRQLAATQIEVAVLDRRRPGRAFRRITGAALDALLPGAPPSDTDATAPPPEHPSTPLATLTPRESDSDKPSTARPKPSPAKPPESPAKPPESPAQPAKPAKPDGTDSEGGGGTPAS
jgi:proteasome alpha subunit